MLQYVALLFTALILVLFDLVYMTYALDRIYRPMFATIQKAPMSLRYGGGVIAWLLIAVGIRYFVLPGFATAPSVVSTFCRGALLGLVVYGVYNGTMYATLSDYTTKVALIDTIWGMFAVGAVSVISGQLFG